ncbi:MAG: pre-peptidase C-terminal domain-containing protein, partial [Burkholderiales bacterium]|nr:pre-peptidase C-terminal domain-containing protein [Burkholderiales bacterium]
QAALDRLGTRLDAVAAQNRRSPQALRELLRQDPTMRLDARGRLFAVDTLERALPAAAPAIQTSGAAPAALDQTFKLHSRPGAQRTIYLDFNGAVLTNTAWNSNGNTITAGPFDADGVVSTDFSAAELERIQMIWQRVAEDFAPLDIDVTTEEPRAGQLTRRNLADEVFGTTVLITSNVGVYDCTCGGVAYVGVFDNVGDRYKPALVFWNMLGSGNEKYVAEAISHEAGHNLGLSHDGYAGGGYYPGHGEGPTGWAPIMGVGYYRELVQWSQGEYATANNTEDDFVVMASNGGPRRPDDHGNAPDSATALTATVDGTQVLLSGQGVIESRDDKDVFSFEAGAGVISLSVQPDSRSANLDVSLRLMDARGRTLGKLKPAETLGAAMSFEAPAAGTYYLQVNGVGIGDVRGTGYGDYGSLGQYRISGSVSAP